MQAGKLARLVMRYKQQVRAYTCSPKILPLITISEYSDFKPSGVVDTLVFILVLDQLYRNVPLKGLQFSINPNRW